MEKGEGNLERDLFNLRLAESSDVYGADRLLQVEKAVDAAHATIVQQAKENELLRSEIQRINEQFEKYKSGHINGQSLHPDNLLYEQGSEHSTADQIVLHSSNQVGGGNAHVETRHCLSDAVCQIDLSTRNENEEVQTPGENQFASRPNGSPNMIYGHHVFADPANASHRSSTLSIPTRFDELNSESEFYDSLMVPNGVTEGNDRVVSKKKSQEQNMEILQLKKYLAEFSLKEAKILDEKFALEKRVSHMSLVFDQQQQDLSFSASKANSYKQDIMEENVRLTYALHAAKEEESEFVAFLMPLLSEHGLQPPVANAQSIVSNLKVLFLYLQEQLLATQGKLKDSQYQLAPWRSEQKNGLVLAPHSGIIMPYSQHPPMAIAEDSVGLSQSGLDDLARDSPIASRSIPPNNMFSTDPFVRVETYLVPKDEGTVTRQVTFENTSSEMDESENRSHQADRELSSSRNSKHTSAALDDPNSYSPSLPPVLEEPSSSFSEAADDDTLPAIEGLQIFGEAYPGQELQASGYSVNGTTCCIFEWVRHLDDGSFNYVEGAKKPTYLVTADDVDTYLAIEVQPLDNRKRKGELVKVFANEHRKISCDPDMLGFIGRTLNSGHASFAVSLSFGYLDLLEPATLAIKKDGYSIKYSEGIVSEKFSSSVIVSISYGSPTEFSIVNSSGTSHVLRAESSSMDVSCSRDTIVLTLRLFIVKAVDKKNKKKKKKIPFFNM